MNGATVLSWLLGMAVGVSCAGELPFVSVREIDREIRVDNCAVTLDAAWSFSTADASPEYSDWHADFAVAFDRDVEAGGVALYGTIGEWQRFQDMDYRGPVYLLKSIGLESYVDYAAVLAMREFKCGVKVEDESLFGMKVTISLRLTDPDNEEHFVTLATCGTVFEAPKQPNWFDSCISQYEVWPEDAKLAIGGIWTAPSLVDAASVAANGQLEIGTLNSMLGFQVDEEKILGETAGVVTIVSRVVSDAYSLENLPPVDPRWKGGVALVRETGALRYYGIVKTGERNEWMPLEGPEALAGEEVVELKMTFKPFGFSTVVTYCIGGCDYAYGGSVEIPVVASQRVSGVLCGGCGIVRSLCGFTEKTKRGSVLILR